MTKKLILGLVLLLGLPLLGWGLDDVTGFLREPARAAYLVSFGAILSVVVIRYPESTRHAGAGTKPVRRQVWAIRWLQVVGLFLAIGAPYADRRDLGVLRDFASARYVGLGLAVVGFVLMLWARAAMGRQFSLHVTIQPEHRLVTAGIYRHVRHPRYAGLLLSVVGMGLLYRSWVALVLAAMTFGVLLWRIHDEEELMQREFGPEWEAYCRKTRRLVPLIY